MIARDQKSDLHGLSFQSSPKINRTLITRPFAYMYNESLQHPTIAVLLIKIVIFFDYSVVFTRSKVIGFAIEFVDRVDPFRKSSIWDFYYKDMKFCK